LTNFISLLYSRRTFKTVRHEKQTFRHRDAPGLQYRRKNDLWRHYDLDVAPGRPAGWDSPFLKNAQSRANQENYNKKKGLCKNDDVLPHHESLEDL